MKIVSPLLKKVVYPAMASAGIFPRTSASGLAVVTYHGVIPAGYRPADPALDGNLVSVEMLRRQLHLLKSQYRLISPEEALAWRQGNFQLPERAVLLTCDDGLLNCLTGMLPVLLEERARCLFFVTGISAADVRKELWYENLFLMLLRAPATSFAIAQDGIELRGELGSRAQRLAVWWSMVKRLSQVASDRRDSFLSAWRAQLASPSLDLKEDSIECRRFGLLTGGELRELAAAGMTIGAHTMSHPMLSQLPADMAYFEIHDSRAQLESLLTQPVWAFAYPFGNPESVTPEILAMPRKAGFDAAFVNFGGGLGTALPVFALPRVHVTAEMNLAEFEAHVSGFHARLQRTAGQQSEIPTTVQA
ncbi:MAG TPA: polysaccharide deacetylase family protein [Candidatus Sulfotelmatobacter sp.]|jgi:peptidoglycan/xylan/chitin deacetylase (PgdA/CDA1 family)